MTIEELEVLGRRAMATKHWTWSYPWCSLPDKHGRVYRRNWSPGDSGFGWTQVDGPIIDLRRETSEIIPDFRDPGSASSLLMQARKVLKLPTGSTIEFDGKWVFGTIRSDDEVQEVQEAWCGAAGEREWVPWCDTEIEALISALEVAP